jgi:hypothetical protein
MNGKAKLAERTQANERGSGIYSELELEFRAEVKLAIAAGLISGGTLKKKECVYCGKDFSPDHLNKKICAECCEAIEPDHSFASCKVCGNVFSKRTKRQVTCFEDECVKEQARKQRLRRGAEKRYGNTILE